MYDKRLETFITVADTGSFSKAAETLYISVPALSKQISTLEKDYGLTLFSRGSRGSHLTKAGASLYKDAKDLITFSSSALSRATLASDDPRILLRIGNELLAPAYGLQQYLKFADLASRYNLQIYSFTDDFNQSDYLYRKIGSSLDGVATLLSSHVLPSDLLLLPLNKIPIGLFLPLGHPLLSNDTVPLSMLNHIPLILPTRGNPLLNEVDRYLHEKLVYPMINRLKLFYSIDAFNFCVSERAAIIAPSIWDGIHPSLLFRPIDWHFTSAYSFVYAKNASPDVLAFINDLRASRNELAKTDTSIISD
jgi:DNA-binding transcriptional LysR family regulator